MEMKYIFKLKPETFIFSSLKKIILYLSGLRDACKVFLMNMQYFEFAK